MSTSRQNAGRTARRYLLISAVAFFFLGFLWFAITDRSDDSIGAEPRVSGQDVAVPLIDEPASSSPSSPRQSGGASIGAASEKIDSAPIVPSVTSLHDASVVEPSALEPYVDKDHVLRLTVATFDTDRIRELLREHSRGFPRPIPFDLGKNVRVQLIPVLVTNRQQRDATSFGADLVEDDGGHASLTVQSGIILGSISTNRRIFEIRPIQPPYHVIFERNPGFSLPED